MKIALVYDRVNKWGGAERVLLALQELFPDAPLYTSVYHPNASSWASGFRITPSILQRMRFLQNKHELVPFLMPSAFENFSFDQYDVVISITSEAAKGIITKPGTAHICYCLTPTRYLWSGYAHYFKNPALRILSKPVVNYLRKWDRIASSRPDVLVAISKEVQRRIKTFYNRDSELIYPPVLLNTPELVKTNTRNQKKGSYYLIVSRLSKFTQYKRIDLAIAACNELGLSLKIIGEGNWRKELESIAGPTIEFLGSVSDKELSKYYKGCKALLFPAMEDFGLTVIEAQGFGKPVIAFRGGGALETIKEGKTGLFFDEQTTESFKQALILFEKMAFEPHICRAQAEKFSLRKFKKEFYRLVNKSF